MEGIQQFFEFTGFANITAGHLVMITVGIIFIYLAIAKEYEPLLLVPIGFGIIIGNIPFVENVLLVFSYCQLRCRDVQRLEDVLKNTLK